jgi:phosphatidylserine/phosphatidylglycerophosphate/cardiolipin synthase-like enzyme
MVPVQGRIGTARVRAFILVSFGWLGLAAVMIAAPQARAAGKKAPTAVTPAPTPEPVPGDPAGDPPSPVAGPGGSIWSTDTDPPLEWLVPYYAGVSNGTIRPVPGLPPDADPQDFFQLDVDAFTQRGHNQDFSAALRQYYGNLVFDWKKQKHEEPYYYMQSWRLLFHPPIKHLTLPRARYVRDLTEPHDPAQADSPYFNPSLHWDIDFSTGTEMTYGNELELRPNQSSYQERLRMLRQAKRYFFGVVMFYMCDQTGQEFENELIRRKKEGVDVRMMVEGLYAYTVNRKCIDNMIKGGVDVIRVDDFWKPAYFSAVIHDKFWIRDGEEAVIGGQNFHDFANMSDGFHMTRDTDVWIKKGPAVTDLEYEYIRLWKRYRNKKKNGSVDPYEAEINEKIQQERYDRTRGRLNYSYWLSDPGKRMNGICRVLVQDRMASRNAIGPVLARYISEAKEHIFMTTPSVDFNLDQPRKKTKNQDHIFDAFVEAAQKKGVKVDLIGNGLAGGMGDMTNFFERFMASEGMKDKELLKRLLLDLGIALSENGAKKDREHMLRLESLATESHAWGYFQFIHAKTQLFDRTLAGVTSFNWDNHSGNINHEAGIFCLDRHLADQLEGQMVTDLVNSVPVVSSNGI